MKSKQLRGGDATRLKHLEFARKVRDILEAAYSLEGGNLARTAQRLNDARTPTATGKVGAWTAATVGRMVDALELFEGGPLIGEGLTRREAKWAAKFKVKHGMSPYRPRKPAKIKTAYNNARRYMVNQTRREWRKCFGDLLVERLRELGKQWQTEGRQYWDNREAAAVLNAEGFTPRPYLQKRRWTATSLSDEVGRAGLRWWSLMPACEAALRARKEYDRECLSAK